MPRPAASGIRRSWAFRNRGLLGALLLVPAAVAVLFSDPFVAEDSVAGFAMDLAGWVSFLLYLTLRLWATLYIGGKKDTELQTRGPYAMTRNPLYLGSLCYALSAAFFLESPLLLFMIMVLGAVYSRAVIKAEEELLEGKFGEEFRSWSRVTPRIFPSAALLRSEQSVEVNMRALRKEALRLWAAALLPFLAEVISHLRAAPWWPHLHWLPIS